MGRPADPPALQEQKGFPGKRRKLTKRRAQDAAALAERLAAAPSAPGDPFAPPRWMDDEALMPACAIWADLAPQLDAIHVVAGLDRHTLAIYCVHMAEWIAANDAIAREGYSRLVKTVSGDKMPRDNPNVKRRDRAWDVIKALIDHFAMTPLARFAMLKDLSAARIARPDLFKPQDGAPVPAAEQPAAPQAVDAVDEPLLGFGSRLNSQPPTMN